MSVLAALVGLALPVLIKSTLTVVSAQQAIPELTANSVSCFITLFMDLLNIRPAVDFTKLFLT